jgi:hypothetical protein
MLQLRDFFDLLGVIKEFFFMFVQLGLSANKVDNLLKATETKENFLTVCLVDDKKFHQLTFLLFSLKDEPSLALGEGTMVINVGIEVFFSGNVF